MVVENRLGIGAPAEPFRTRSAASSEEWSDSGSAESPTCRMAGNRQKRMEKTLGLEDWILLP